MNVYQINVTEKHIQNGEKHSAHLCPIALAAKEQLREHIENISSLNVGPKDVDVYINSAIHRRLYLSREARKFVEAFDSDRVVQPSSFILTEK